MVKKWKDDWKVTVFYKMLRYTWICMKKQTENTYGECSFPGLLNGKSEILKNGGHNAGRLFGGKYKKFGAGRRNVA